MIFKVARLGHPVLRQIAEPVPPDDITTPEVQQFIDDLIETMYEYDGAGLAAPQVHVSHQVVVMEVTQNPRYPEAPAIPLTVYINPKITPLSEDMDEDWEGCLSVPGLRGRVPRHTAIRLRAYNRQGKRVDFVAEGFQARVIQHECDHLQGKVFLDRMRDMSSLTFIEEFVKYGLHE
ncbi:Peptide deformylase [Candidatus Entotheonellaceae bacterium PAL068K]